MDFDIITGVGFVGVLIALMQLAKLMGLNSKFVPLIAVGVSVIGSITTQIYGTEALYEAIWIGVITGLTAIGLYSGTKNTIEAIK